MVYEILQYEISMLTMAALTFLTVNETLITYQNISDTEDGFNASFHISDQFGH